MELKPSAVTAVLHKCIAAKLPVFVWGAPGIGKSAVVKAIADELDIELRDVRVTLLDPVDLRGVPSIVDGITHWNPPEFLPQAGQGVLFLDELSAAPPAIQAACYQLVLDRKLGDYTLPDGWTIVAAGNRETDRAVTYRMSSALSSRFVHLDMTTDLNDWSKWAINADMPIETIAFVRFRPELLHAFDAKQRSFPCPRTWEYAGRLTGSMPAGAELATMAGIVGDGAAAEYLAFLQVFRDMPSPDQILMAPTTAPVPAKPAVRYALCTALAARATAGNVERVCQYASRLPAEFGAMLIRDIMQRDQKLATAPAVAAWCVKHAEYCFT